MGDEARPGIRQGHDASGSRAAAGAPIGLASNLEVPCGARGEHLGLDVWRGRGMLRAHQMLLRDGLDDRSAGRGQPPRQEGISIILISQGSSEHSICCAVPQDQAGRAATARRAF